MKSRLFILLAAALMAVGAYYGYYRVATAESAAMLCNADGEMEWLRHEFRLTDAQFEKIKVLSSAYQPVCERMCGRIAGARARLDHLIDSNKSVTPPVEAAFKEYTAVEGECRQALLGHVYEISAAMSPESGARYLKMMKEHILLPYNATSRTALKPGMHH